MRFMSAPSFVKRIRSRWTEWVGWLLLVCYVGILFWMSLGYWHIRHFALFISILIGFTVIILLVFRLLGGGDREGGGERG